MATFKKAKARSLEMYNKVVLKKELREKRIVVVVDEIAEIMPTFKGKANSDLVEINSTLNKIARMGRAVGINLVVGVQKPDAKNLDPTIKANLSGVLCFAVSHFTQSTIVLGNSRAADLNKEFKGRAIWKHGLEFVEVQVPLLTEEEVLDVRNKIDGYWKQRNQSSSDRKEITLNSETNEKNSQTRSPPS
jgi:DNA segregation ATPase FtsK/SpoIIIE-like protein